MTPDPLGEDPNVYQGLAGNESTGAGTAGPPWILGHRGTPLEAPENTLSGLHRALECGLDGFEYDLRACRSGEAVIMHDATLTRTTDSQARLSDLTLPQLFGIDAGSWFSKRYRGEPVPLFDEALALTNPEGKRPFHMIEIKENGLVEEVRERLQSVEGGLDFRIASFLREVVLEARDAGLPSMLLADTASEDDRRFTRDERIQAHGVGPGGWETTAGAADWGRVERWGWSVDRPEHLLAACREPLFAFNTNQPYRALAVRALCRLAPHDRGAYPLGVPDLRMEPEALEATVRAGGEWFGDWNPVVWLRNPFAYPVEVRVTVVFPSGAFELRGLPRFVDLEPGEERSVDFGLAGGSRAPGRDPLVVALYQWQASPGRPAGQLLFDAPLSRVRSVVADGLTRRLTMLRESPGDPGASMTLRRQGDRVVVQLEDTRGLQDAHAVVRLAGETHRGGRAVTLRLPEGFDQTPKGTDFSCGIEALRGGQRVLLRWAGGLPAGIANGAPGRLLPLGKG
ncbi:MAG: hypothetical protein H6830_02930 [Planctomycetes bacterium]|nr:hypothetical protein [Planctomycetota bacterium]MCB9910102.1 hypothetical protein [Planctomycetota bacterium]MCB9913351.1 hypothetical protein [Planctomycetota bacterium]HPF14415.1 glycerophosphodiester phosphodiesterase family protein [Planctomycetota bacterium]